MKVQWRGRSLTLTAADFVAQGGQAKVYARDGQALKLFTSAVPPQAKLAALRACNRPGIVAPTDEVYDENGVLIGFSMPLLDGWSSLIQLVPRAYRDRHGLDVARIGSLVLQLRELVEHAHRHQALIVDLNELNVLVSPSHDQVSLIDVDSWQIAGFPASALAPGVQDHRSTGFSTGTDWFAFAVVSFQLFSGIHPFRGRHPTVKTLEERVKGGLSVFHPEVVVPPMAELNTPWRAWYEAVFAQGERTEPPLDLSGTVRSRAPRPVAGVTVSVFLELQQALRGVASWSGRSWAWTEGGLYEGRRRLGPAPAAGSLPIRGPSGVHFVRLHEGELQLWQDGFRSTGLHASSLTAHEGVLHGRVGAQLLEYTPVELGGTVVLRARVAASCAPYSTQLFRGVAINVALGATWLTVLGAGTAVQQRAPELDGARVVDAVSTAGVTVVITQGSSGWLRHVFGRDGHRSSPTTLPSAQLVVLPTGVALLQTDEGLELFEAKRPCGAVRAVSVELPAPLTCVDGRPGYLEGTRWNRIQLAG